MADFRGFLGSVRHPCGLLPESPPQLANSRQARNLVYKIEHGFCEKGTSKWPFVLARCQTLATSFGKFATAMSKASNAVGSLPLNVMQKLFTHWCGSIMGPRHSEMLEATVTRIGKPTAEHGAKWKATAAWQGVAVEAVSRGSPIYDLCRALKAAGCPDVGIQIRFEGRPALTIASLHRAALLTVRESPVQPMRQSTYQPWVDRLAVSLPPPRHSKAAGNKG